MFNKLAKVLCLIVYAPVVKWIIFIYLGCHRSIMCGKVENDNLPFNMRPSLSNTHKIGKSLWERYNIMPMDVIQLNRVNLFDFPFNEFNRKNLFTITFRWLCSHFINVFYSLIFCNGKFIDTLYTLKKYTFILNELIERDFWIKHIWIYWMGGSWISLGWQNKRKKLIISFILSSEK